MKNKTLTLRDYQALANILGFKDDITLIDDYLFGFHYPSRIIACDTWYYTETNEWTHKQLRWLVDYYKTYVHDYRINRLPDYVFLFLHELGHAVTMTKRINDEYRDAVDELNYYVELYGTKEFFFKYRFLEAEYKADMWAIQTLQTKMSNICLALDIL